MKTSTIIGICSLGLASAIFLVHLFTHWIREDRLEDAGVFVLVLLLVALSCWLVSENS
jgi:NhaP-type Na+/H+ or K+/H+ antiporter